MKTLPGGKRKGVNRISWRMRLKPPKTEGRTVAAGALFGPQAQEGKYKVRLVKGKETYETWLEIGPSPLNKHSAEDRKVQYETVMALYRFQEDLSFFSAQIKDLKEKIEATDKKVEKGKLKGLLSERSEALMAFHDTIVSPSESPFVDQSRLREDVIKLYAGVNSYQGRPSTDQLSQMETLKVRFQEARKNADTLLDIASLNKQLERKGLKALELLTRKTWNEESEKGSGFHPQGFSLFRHFSF